MIAATKTTAVGWNSSRLREALIGNAPWLLAGIGLLAMYVPTLYGLATTAWATDEQGHGPIVLSISIWLLWRGRNVLCDWDGATPRPILGTFVVLIGLLLYAVGRSQDIQLFEVGSLVWLTTGLILLLNGTRALTSVWFALFFMLFTVPLPSALVDALTQPMKMAVSYVATQALHALGYPVARNGVIIYAGPYQLLVADACAGLHTLFTLEALGLLYLNVVRTSLLLRNIALAILIIPISFIANVIRVLCLTLVTYHFGDEAGQGFIHGFAGMVLFLSALTLIIIADGLLRMASARRQSGTQRP